MQEWIHTWTYYDQSPVTVFLVFLLICLFSLIPAIVAFLRKHRSRWTILILNILLGWTVIGWVITLVWSLSYPGERQKE